MEYARLIEDDLHWLGLGWDRGGVDGTGEGAPFCQSLRGRIYSSMLDRIMDTGYAYPCTCTKADIRATQAPHGSDGRIIYPGTCRPKTLPAIGLPECASPHAIRIFVPDGNISFTDLNYGPQCINPAEEFGDFVLRRADGAWAYQFAVVADDALMGVTEVVRGSDLLPSAACQIYLYDLLGFPRPMFMHIPMICNSAGIRLSKRDESLSMESLRRKYAPEQIIGFLANLSGLTDSADPISAKELVPFFSAGRLVKKKNINI